jgi:AMME syndrome candidate gene 1 protein
MENTIQATKAHCKYCFEVLIAKLTKQAPPAWPAQLNNVSVPLFVTWTYTKNDELRGCIGTFSEQKLQTVLPQYTLISALQDDRFEPITL